MSSLKSLAVVLGIIPFIYPLGSLNGKPLLWPIKTEPALTSTFGEYRPGHFHGGVDIKTYGQIGIPCVAVDDGWIVRMKVSGTGYGRALYLELESGEMAVYAHLDRFTQNLMHTLYAVQNASRRYEQDIYFEGDDKIPVKRGDIIGYTGRSGTTHPHLHFEIRSGWDIMLNPLSNGLAVKDTEPPTPLALAVTPLDEVSSVENDIQPRLYRRLIRHHDGIWRIGEPVGAHGNVGVSIDCYDRADTADNLMAAYSITLEINGEQIWRTRFDAVGFEHTRQIELERDNRLLRRGLGAFHRLYQSKGQTLLGVVSGGGGISLTLPDDFPATAEITLSDVAGNESRVEFVFVDDRVIDPSRVVMGETFPRMSSPSDNGGTIQIDYWGRYFRLGAPPGVAWFEIVGSNGLRNPARPVEGGMAALWTPSPYLTGQVIIRALSATDSAVAHLETELIFASASAGVAAISRWGQFSVSAPPAAFYDDVYLRVVPEPSFQIPGWVENVVRIEPRDMPLAGPVTVGLSIVRHRFESGWGIYYYDRKRGWTFLDNRVKDGFLIAEALSWEIFALVKDLDEPSIKVISPVSGAALLSRRPLFEAAIDDSTSGVIAAGVEMRIDGATVPAEFDAPLKVLRYMALNELSIGSHQAEFIAEDRVGNRSRKMVEFIIQPGR